jgi:hypothetical protein
MKRTPMIKSVLSTAIAIGFSLGALSTATAEDYDMFAIDTEAKLRLSQLAISATPPAALEAEITTPPEAIASLNGVLARNEVLADDGAGFLVEYADNVQLSATYIYGQVAQAYDTLYARICYWADNMQELGERDGASKIYAVLDQLETGGGLNEIGPHDFDRVGMPDVIWMQDEVAAMIAAINDQTALLPDASATNFQFATSIFRGPLNEYRARMIDICYPPAP